MSRLLLFDVDGTLVSGGPAKEAFEVAMVEAFGTAGDVEGVSFAGKTDPQIARELLHGVGMEDRDIDLGLPSLWSRYLTELESRLPARPVRVLEGVHELLSALEATGVAVLGLVTGNILGGARLKLGSAGLMGRFRVGGYGSDHETRDRLPEIAIRRTREELGKSFRPEEVVVVGDTPRDVACGRHAGTRTVAVASGHFDTDVLEAAGPDAVLEDLGATDEVLEILLEGL